MQLWDFLKEKQKIQVKNFIQNIEFQKSNDILMLLDALDSTKEFQSYALEKVKTYPQFKLPEFIYFITKHNPKLKMIKIFYNKLFNLAQVI